jgi:hypothetical protein
MAAGDAAAVAALIRAAFAAQSVVTDPLPSALRVTEAEVMEHLRTGAGAVAEAAGGVVGSALWVEKDGGLLGAAGCGAGLARPRRGHGTGGRGGGGGALDGSGARSSEHAPGVA